MDLKEILKNNYKISKYCYFREKGAQISQCEDKKQNK